MSTLCFDMMLYGGDIGEALVAARTSVECRRVA